MGLKCSVLGHKYGDATVERDREEQGSEVVITIREIETCGRCGTERVVSENKEVTTLATPEEPADADPSIDAPDADEVADVADGDEPGGADGGGADGEGDAEAARDPETPAGPSAASDDGVAGGRDSGTGTADSPPSTGADAGAEILDAEADEPVTDDELADPSIDDAPVGTDPVVEDADGEDAVIIDGSDDADDVDEGRAPGEWPSEPETDDGPGWRPSEPDAGDDPITAPDSGTDANAAVTVPDGDFRCPACGYTTPVESSSLRAGDFCPECHEGSLVHDRGDETRKG